MRAQQKLGEESFNMAADECENVAKGSGSQKNVTHNINDQCISTILAVDYFQKFVFLQGFKIPSKYKLLYIAYSSWVNFWSIIYLPIAFAISFAQLDNFEIDALLTSFQVAVNAVGGSIKALYLFYMLPQLERVNDLITQLDARCKGSDEVQEQLSVIALGRRIILAFVTTYYSYCVSTMLGNLVNGRPPYSIYLPGVNWRNNPAEFYSAAFIELYMIFLAANQQVFNDGYGVVYVSVLRAHMRILILRVGKLGTNENMSVAQKLEELKLCIKDHKNLLNYHRLIQPLLSGTIFVQFVLTALMMSMTFINITIFSNDIATRIGSIVYVSALFAQAFPICYFATSLQSESDRLCTSIFHSHWFNQGSIYRQMMVFFMQNTQKTMQFKANKIFLIALPTFISIAKFTFSLYTLISAMDIKAKLGL